MRLGILIATWLPACVIGISCASNEGSTSPNPSPGTPSDERRTGDGGEEVTDADTASDAAFPDGGLGPKDASEPEDDSGPVDASEPEEAGSPIIRSFQSAPLPIQASLAAVSGTSADDVWAVGGNTILRWDGTSWAIAYQHDTSASSFFSAVWTREKDEMWAIGDQLLVRYSKKGGAPPSFREIPVSVASSKVQAHWLTPTGDALWAVRGGGEVVRLKEDADGSIITDRWTPKASESDTLKYLWRGVWGFAPDDIYVSGAASPTGASLSANAAIGHYDGSKWSIVVDKNILGFGFYGLYGSPPVANQKKQLWVRLPPSKAGYYLYPDVGSGGLGSYEFVPTPGGFVLQPKVYECKLDTGSSHDTGFVASSADAWFSAGCLIYRWDGSELEEVPAPTDGGTPLGNFSGVWANRDGAVWAVGHAFPDAGTSIGLAMRGEP